MELRTQTLTRYITPLREGGSLPALGEADDGFRYVVKLRGAGHGAKSLISELVGGLVAKAFKFKVPETVLLSLSPLFGITEPDQEVQELLRKSEGLNVGLHFLDKASTFDPTVNDIDELTASKIVWMDAFLTNVDRTWRNTNMLLWHKRELWLIDHGSSLYFHHNWDGWERAALSPFPYVKDHALLRDASLLEEADREMHSRITPALIDEIVASVPEEWLLQASETVSPDEQRRVYSEFLKTRLSNSKIFVDHAREARKALV